MPTSGGFLLTLDARKKPTRGKYIYSGHKAFKRIPGVVGSTPHYSLMPVYLQGPSLFGAPVQARCRSGVVEV
jgi:hypothetical protein